MSMKFPSFETLQLAHKDVIQPFTSDFEPYSDFDFTSLWSYNTHNSIEIAILDSNLVIRFEDYISNESFLSFIGKNAILDTTRKLFQYIVLHQLPLHMKLIPECVIHSSQDLTHNFRIIEDRDNFDYILSIDGLCTLQGGMYAEKRNFVNRFIKKYGDVAPVTMDLANIKVQKDILELFHTWEMRKQLPQDDTVTERNAIKRLLEIAHVVPQIAVGIYINKQLIAFSINEVVGKYFVNHFEKADTSYIGSFQYLKKMSANAGHDRGCVYINYEQDLGIPGLRKAKESWQPVKYLKKYTISPW